MAACFFLLFFFFLSMRCAAYACGFLIFESVNFLDFVCALIICAGEIETVSIASSCSFAGWLPFVHFLVLNHFFFLFTFLAVAAVDAGAASLFSLSSYNSFILLYRNTPFRWVDFKIFWVQRIILLPTLCMNIIESYEKRSWTGRPEWFASTPVMKTVQ